MTPRAAILATTQVRYDGEILRSYELLPDAAEVIFAPRSWPDPHIT